MRTEKSPYPIFKVQSNQIRTLTRFEKSLYSISKYQQQSKDPNQGFTALKAIHRNHEFYPSGLLTHFFSFTKHIQVLVCITIIHIHTINQQQWSGLQIIHTCLDCKTNPGTCCWIIHTINQSNESAYQEQEHNASQRYIHLTIQYPRWFFRVSYTLLQPLTLNL